MKKVDESVYLHHILDAITRIEDYISNTKIEGFHRQDITKPVNFQPI
jgi:uncharacterized protein with HEPN domain